MPGRGRLTEPIDEPFVEPAQPKPKKRVEHKAYTRSLGNGPPCPDGLDPETKESRHGNLYDWGPGHDKPWYCSHEEHGGNGKFFNDAQVQS